METNVGVTSDDFFYKLDTATFSKTTLVEITSLGITSPGDVQVSIDEDAGYVFFAVGLEVYRIDYPTATSITTLHNPGNSAMTIDIANQRVIFADGSGNAAWMDYDGNNIETLLDWPAADDIVSMNKGDS